MHTYTHIYTYIYVVRYGDLVNSPSPIYISSKVNAKVTRQGSFIIYMRAGGESGDLYLYISYM